MESKELCFFWDIHAKTCRYEMLFLGCNPCDKCPEEGGTTMTVKELIAELQKYDEEIPVLVAHSETEYGPWEVNYIEVDRDNYHGTHLILK